MSKFLIGQCVGLKERLRESNRDYFGSFHILNSKDITRGYYETKTAKYDLRNCEAKTYHSFKNSFMCDTLKGKSVQPISGHVFSKIERASIFSSDVCHIMFKGQKWKLEGYLYDNQFYFYFREGQHYKAKVYTDKDGYVVGRGVTLSEKQKRKNYRIEHKEHKVTKEALNEIIKIAVHLVLSREGDVDTEDGTFATVSTDDIICLEQAIVEAFDLNSDDVCREDVSKINKMLGE